VPVKKIFVIINVCLLCFISCTPAPTKTPVWEQVKFKDLAHPKKTDPAGNFGRLPLQFTFHIFSVPPANFDFVKDLWQNLSDKPLHFADKNIFRENGFMAGAGQAETWRSAAEKLRTANAKNLKTIDLIIFDNNPSDVSLISSDHERNIFYRTADNQISGVTLGKGEAMFRISAAAVSDMRGVCNMTVEPLFKNTTSSDNSSGLGGELSFGTASLTAKMSPQDFVLIGPANYTPRGMTPESVFFLPPDNSSIQIYLIVCTGVNN
jgi:hypothetical protein